MILLFTCNFFYSSSVNSTSVTVSGLSAFSNFKMYIENCTTKDRISEMVDVGTKADG